MYGGGGSLAFVFSLRCFANHALVGMGVPSGRWVGTTGRQVTARGGGGPCIGGAAAAAGGGMAEKFAVRACASFSSFRPRRGRGPRSAPSVHPDVGDRMLRVARPVLRAAPFAAISRPAFIATEAAPTSIHQFKSTLLDGSSLDFSSLAGKPAIVLNVASK